MTAVVDTSVLIDYLPGHPRAAQLLERERADGADLAIAATVLQADARLLTRNVKHFPMFVGLDSPYH